MRRVGSAAQFYCVMYLSDGFCHSPKCPSCVAIGDDEQRTLAWLATYMRAQCLHSVGDASLTMPSPTSSTRMGPSTVQCYLLNTEEALNSRQVSLGRDSFRVSLIHSRQLHTYSTDRIGLMALSWTERWIGPPSIKTTHHSRTGPGAHCYPAHLPCFRRRNKVVRVHEFEACHVKDGKPALAPDIFCQSDNSRVPFCRSVTIERSITARKGFGPLQSARHSTYSASLSGPNTHIHSYTVKGRRNQPPDEVIVQPVPCPPR